MATFMYAFSRLSPVNLDGTPNANKPVQNRRYGPVSGLLDTLLFYNGDPCYAMRKVYVARHKTDHWDSTTLVVSIEQIDLAVSNAILGVLYALDFRHQQGLQDSLYEQLEAMAQEKRAEGVSLGTALKNIDTAIHGWELDKVSSRETGNKTGLDEANRELARLYQARADVIAKEKEALLEEEKIAETKSLHNQVIERWYQMPFELQQRFVRLIVKSVTMVEISPHILRMELTYKPPIGIMQTGYVLRKHGDKPPWLDAETQVIRQLYPQADRAAILKAIPKRTWLSIRAQAEHMGVKRETSEDTSGIPMYLSFVDYEQVESLQGEYIRFGKPLRRGGVVDAVWQNFDSAVLDCEASKSENLGSASL
ncbi:MAG: hypothetical protein ACXWOL_08990 [Ktedonobacteraceae bacterium]